MTSLLHLITIFGFIATIILTTSKMTSARYPPPPCRPCWGDECDTQPRDTCLWGETRDGCGWKVCAKGPGELCGGPMNRHGDCGEGMYCKKTDGLDGRCFGCSITTMQCY